MLDAAGSETSSTRWCVWSHVVQGGQWRGAEEALAAPRDGSRGSCCTRGPESKQTDPNTHLDAHPIFGRFGPVGWSTTAGGAIIDVKFNPAPGMRQLLVGTAGAGDGKEASLFDCDTGDYKLLQVP